MSEVIDMISGKVDTFNQLLKDTISAKGMTTTGEAARSIRKELGNDFVNSIGVFYLEFLDTGRGSGKMPPVNKLIIWAAKKYGLSGDAARSAGWAVALKIQRVGTEIFRNNKKGLELTKKISNLREEINSELPESAKADVKQVLNKYKKLFEAKQFKI